MKLMKWPGTSTLKKIVRAFSDSFSICCMIWAHLNETKKLLYTDINEYNYFIKTIQKKYNWRKMRNKKYVQLYVPSSVSTAKFKSVKGKIYYFYSTHTKHKKTHLNTKYLIEGLVYQSGWIRCKCKQGSTKVPFYDLAPIIF